MSSKPVFTPEGGFIPEVYENLRRIAEKYLRSSRGNHTLQPTALVNEALLTFVGKSEGEWQSRAHFQACAAQMMRWILLDHAKAKKRQKRGGAEIRVTFDENLHAANSEIDVIAMDEALTRLAQENPRIAKVVELRFFGGMSIEEVAEALKLSIGTVKRDWNLARAWLQREFRESTKS